MSPCTEQCLVLSRNTKGERNTKSVSLTRYPDMFLYDYDSC